MASKAQALQRVAAVAESQAAEQPKPGSFPALIATFRDEIAVVLPRHLNADRMARIALTEFRRTPKLANCDPKSVFAAIVIASQLGLEPGLMGNGWLIPYGTECQFIPGYQGLLDLVRRTGRVKRIEAHVVHDLDEFKYRAGTDPILVHEPYLGEDSAGPPILAYAVAEFTDGGFHVEVMTRREIERIRDRSQNVISAAKYGKKTPWDTDPEEMWRKTVLRRICKYLPKSPELATALALDDAASRGSQGLDLRQVATGEWVPPAVPEPEPSDIQSVETSPDAKITEHQLTTLQSMYKANGWSDDEVLQFARQLPGGGVERLADLTASGYNVVCKQFATKRRETPAPAASAEHWDNPDADPPPDRGRGLELEFDAPKPAGRKGAK